MAKFSTFKPDDESGRLAALHRYEILDTPSEKEFDDIVALVKTVFRTDFAAVTLIDADRQTVKASAGLDMPDCDRADSFCTHTIRTAEPLQVPDALTDPRFVTSSFVTGRPGLRSYLGAPLMTPDGYNVGALCVFDTRPRSFTPQEAEVLQNFARVVVSQMELRQTARRDGLTRALSRRAFQDRVEAAVAGEPAPDAASAEAVRTASLILVDIDHFKRINDTYGHPAGDRVLCAVVDSMTAQVRRTDALGRVGGEEFALLLPDTGQEAAMALAERLRAAVAGQPIPAIGLEPPTISLGVAELRRGETAEAWFARADRALYAAKRGGRNRAVAAEERAG
ncbi:sensor domain-containing diguanylate cyclase [Frigidibacter oleivorans]|uniref:sensor domain-containing diguanylate cyclase n=1 Tax=Frigidibacter oleivorans TaxID=2487129 RepID=UPI000F8EE320|nr:sensor domain-containing diguanylate cyclase [Frigidibacter oleivorans]